MSLCRCIIYYTAVVREQSVTVDGASTDCNEVSSDTHHPTTGGYKFTENISRVISVMGGRLSKALHD